MHTCDHCDQLFTTRTGRTKHMNGTVCVGKLHLAPSEIECNLCNQNHPLESYGVFKNGPWGRRRGCNTCRGIHESARIYGVSAEEYKANRASSGSCELCGSTETLCYDHDHTTMKFRGILCRMCNSAVGHFGDDVEGVQKVLNYLKRSI